MRLGHTWLGFLGVGTVIVVGSGLVAILVVRQEEQSVQTPDHSEVAASRGGTLSPAQDYRQARYQEALRGLRYDTGFVEVGPDGQAHPDGDLEG